MTTDINALFQNYIAEIRIFQALGIMYYVLTIAFCIFVCWQLWKIRVATQQTKAETLHVRQILDDLVKAKHPNADEKQTEGKRPLDDSQIQENHSNVANSKSYAYVLNKVQIDPDEKYRPKS
jgi:hypothetical protein